MDELELYELGISEYSDMDRADFYEMMGINAQYSEEDTETDEFESDLDESDEFFFD